MGRLPFVGEWLTEVSPTRRIPSHGTHLFATTYALDFIAVNEGGRTARGGGARPLFSTESPQHFYAFDQPIYSPVDGTVIDVHDGEPDHQARRSAVPLLFYALSQKGRMRRGFPGLAGNYVIVEDAATGHFVGLAHLREGSVAVSAGEAVRAGVQIGTCGNSGNSTQPHLHIQAMDGPDPESARGVPLRFSRFAQHGPGRPLISANRENACPEQGSIVSIVSRP